MSGSSYEQRLAEAMAELDATRAAVARAEAELAEAAVTVRSKDRSVEVTVGPQGELTGLRFLEDRYRTMAAGQLAASVLEAAAEARGLMARQVMDLFEPFTLPSERVPELTGVDVDWARIFGPAVLEDSPGRDAGRRRHDDIADEITEDPEEEHRHG
ncbi:YbaB/EbfC family nucleoid-associated protein [Streptomyces griseorubiginosus]|uniref:YbaB/EbfC family nucleoid-associated protein n=1 Tax=Streptomyces griseorubiginosus TaxID=67304 RepID=UPI0036F0CC08